MIDRYLDVYRGVLETKKPRPPSPEKLAWRNHDYWDRPMAFTEIPPRPTRPVPTPSY
jgi:hypothetical protein